MSIMTVQKENIQSSQCAPIITKTRAFDHVPDKGYVMPKKSTDMKAICGTIIIALVVVTTVVIVTVLVIGIPNTTTTITTTQAATITTTTSSTLTTTTATTITTTTSTTPITTTTTTPTTTTIFINMIYEIMSPNYPHPYPADLEKTWLLEAHAGSLITIQFLYFHVRILKNDVEYHRISINLGLFFHFAD